MKTSIKYLPPEKQEDLKYLVSLILERVSQTEMIILYGSYATGKYVDRDSRVEFGIRTTYMSDYDILVVTSGSKDKDAGQKLDNIEEIYYKYPDKQTPVQFVNDSIHKLNKDLLEGRYFYTQIKQEGIKLYDSGRYKLARRRKLQYDEIRQQAEEYFKEKYQRAAFFFDDALANYQKERYQMASFYLHQTCENLFYSVRLVFTLENNKQHNLAKLQDSVRKYSNEFEKILPHKTEEEKRLFNLVKAAYVEARYNPNFLVTKKDIDSLVPIMKQLFNLVNELCEMRVLEYEGMSMIHIYSRVKRHLVISGKKEKDDPELIVRKFLFSHKYHYRLNVKALPGKKDIVISKQQTVIFINDCFWFGHDREDHPVMPKTRVEWWKNRIRKNREWDQKYVERLLKQGWRVASVWECDLDSGKQEHTLARLLDFLENDGRTDLYAIPDMPERVADTEAGFERNKK